MKSAKPAAADSASQRRSQPVRQTRTNPPRSSLHAGRVGSQREPLSSAPAGDQPIDIFPAITHFADTISALPKELVRHFTLLKEVDAKIFAPQEQLFKLVSAAAAPPSAPDTQQVVNDASSTDAPTSAPMSVQGSSSGTGLNPSVPPSLTGDPNAASGVFDPSNIPRRQLFRQTAFKIQEMLVSLEEKNHVISTANDALNRQLSRIEDVWPHLENEFSDEAKWGSSTHWAYPENRGRSYPEHARRAGAAAISAAAQALADEAAARSDARKQAVQAKRSLKNNNLDSDMDDKQAKKSAKARRAADTDNVGLGISGSANGNPQKRRKVEKTTNGGTAMERTVSSALGSNPGKAKTNSPRATPAPDGTKKRRALPTASGQAKKKTATVGKPQSAASSPVMGNLPDPKVAASPNIASAPRPQSSRARQNSVGPGPENGKARPSSSANKPNGSTPDATNEPATADNDKTAPKEAGPTVKTEPAKKGPEQTNGGPTSASSRRESKTEDAEIKNEAQPLPQPATVTTKSGRASKPSTPALATFQEAAAQRQSRSRDNGGSKKKKVASTAQALAQQATDEDGNSSMQGEGDDEDGDIDADEPTYCYCNSVSYGEMVACDSDDCEREWFHLACAGLKVAPGSKTKWYCEDCKERLKLAGKKTNSR